MKKKRSIFLLLGVLALLLIIYFALQAWNTRKEEKSEEESNVQVTDIDPADITALRFDVGNGEMECEKEGGAGEDQGGQRTQ